VVSLQSAGIHADGGHPTATGIMSVDFGASKVFGWYDLTFLTRSVFVLRGVVSCDHIELSLGNLVWVGLPRGHEG
jgi:hypothetical protein